MPDIYGRKQGDKMWSDFGKKEQPEQPVLPEAQPAQTPQTGAVQQPPIVQPLIIVPYASQMQPLYQYTPEAYGEGIPPYANGFDYDDEFGGDFEEEPVAESKRRARKEKRIKNKVAKTGPNGGAITAFLFSLLAIVAAVVSYFVSIPYINITDGESLLGIVISTFSSIIGGGLSDIMTMIFPLALTVAAIFGLLTYIVSAFSLSGKYPVIGKIFAAVALIGAAVAIIMIFVDKMTVAYGAYILPGLIALAAICALAAKRKMKGANNE